MGATLGLTFYTGGLVGGFDYKRLFEGFLLRLRDCFGALRDARGLRLDRPQTERPRHQASEIQGVREEQKFGGGKQNAFSINSCVRPDPKGFGVEGL